MISGINHITIAIKDLNHSFEFYKDILGFKPLMKHSKGAYLLAGDLWFCLDVDSSARKETLPEYTHFAFTVEQKDFNEMVIKHKNSGVEILKENKSEGDQFTNVRLINSKQSTFSLSVFSCKYIGRSLKHFLTRFNT